MVHNVKAWRERLAGRVKFDLPPAEAAVRRAYKANSLAEPSEILWANGPSDAAQAIAFVQNPPRRLNRMALAILIFGATASVGLALALDDSAVAARPPATAVLWSTVLAGFGLALGGLPKLPLPPGVPSGSHPAKLILVGAVIFVALAGWVLGLLHLGGLPAEPVGRGVALAVAALVGTLPGVFLRVRMRSAYAHLPQALRKLTPSTTVAVRLQRVQENAWASFQRTTVDLRVDDTLIHAYRAAHGQPFIPRHAFLLDSGRTIQVAQDTSWTGSIWIGGGVWRNPGIGVTPHLDGIESAAQAAVVGETSAPGMAATFAELAFHVDRLYPFAAIAVAVRPATTIALDPEGRPHAENGPALAWADGTRLYAWHGQLVSPEVIDPDRPVTLSRIHAEADPAQRRVLIQRYGLGRYCVEAGASEIQHDDCGRLYRLRQGLGEPLMAVRVVNHTPEPDGSLREFWLRVPPTATTARQAVAWTFDLSAEEYNLVAQS
ncbi:DUF6745 domain-containing protein [Chelativorans xinjiangense]|uniref:DUF6745 domain-containing protein n=1 Tax=Chelativorans xinjiangense TaxID=2681485 RepID=UPI00135A761B|nr:hypothetical protein [Chelativorans xinjiangense]